MIKSVKKIRNGVFLINDCVQVSNIEAKEEKNIETCKFEMNVYCDIRFNEDKTTEDNANKIASEFINRSIEYGIEGE